MAKPVLLIVDDDEAFLNSSRRALSGDYDVLCAKSEAEAAAFLSPPPDVVLLDVRLNERDPDNKDGLVVLQSLRQRLPDTPVLMITAHGEIEVAVEAMRLGAVDFIQKPRAELREIKARLRRAVEHSRLSRRVTQLEQELSRLQPREIIGASSGMLEVNRVIDALAVDGHVTVLVRGETGTGKELVARAIHSRGWRRTGPFVPVMLNALPLSMLESELFGYESGAFTDARDRHIGYLEKAHGGVLFLDEIGDVDANVQVKLLRFIEEREFQRLGSTAPIKVDVQIVAATNANLEDSVREKRFREDLYFRLKVHEIALPSLQERPEDIPLLVDYFIELFRHQGKKVGPISRTALEALQECPWPGNVRQLRNAIESAIFNAEMRRHRRIEVEDLPADLRGAGRVPLNSAETQTGPNIHEVLARTELSCIAQALRTAHGKKAEASRILGYNDRFAMYRRVRRILEQHPQMKDEFPQLTSVDSRDS